MGWLKKTGLNDLVKMIKAQGWVKLFCKSISTYQNAYRMCLYVKGVWEILGHYDPLKTTRMSAHDEAIKEVGRVKSIQMRPSTRFLHLLIIKNVLPRFAKRDVAGFAELTYMTYMVKKKIMNFPRLIIRHMAHVINTPKHELPYAELLTIIFKAFDIPMPEQDEKEPVETDFFKESFLNMCELKRNNGVWWLGSGENRRRDEEEVSDLEEESKEEKGDSNKGSYEKEGTNSREESTPAGIKRESSDSEDTHFDAIDDDAGNVKDDHDDVNEVGNTQQAGSSQKKSGQSTNAGGIDPSSMATDFQLPHLQEQLQQAMQEN
ncbi:hypothetical protein Dimus_011017, partial [Dionaea muscipula]